MPRPRLRVGAHGNIKTKKTDAKTWESSTYVRDADGRRRRVRATATSKGRAEQNLQDALAKRTGHGRELSGDSTVAEVAAHWRHSFEDMVATEQRAPNSLRTYVSVLESHVLPGVGELRLWEATVTRLDRFVLATRAQHGASVTKTSRTVLNGVMDYAVRHGALTTNPMREVSRVPGASKRKPRALSLAERETWLRNVEADPMAVDRDVPDLTRFLLATGARIGEALAVTFAEVSLMEATVAIDYNLVAVKGEGLRRMRTKTRAGERTLLLPGWAVEMLARRYAELGDGPVFPSMRAGTWRDPSNTSRAFREARAAAGFDWLTPHTFRKTVATVMSEAGMSAREIADQMGHSLVSMTQDVYLGRAATTGRHAAALEEMGF